MAWEKQRAAAQRTHLLQRLKLVEERRDERRVDGQHDQAEREEEGPQVQRQQRARHLRPRAGTPPTHAYIHVLSRPRGAAPDSRAPALFGSGPRWHDGLHRTWRMYVRAPTMGGTSTNMRSSCGAHPEAAAAAGTAQLAAGVVAKAADTQMGGVPSLAGAAHVRCPLLDASQRLGQRLAAVRGSGLKAWLPAVRGCCHA